MLCISILYASLDPYLLTYQKKSLDPYKSFKAVSLLLESHFLVPLCVHSIDPQSATYLFLSLLPYHSY
jgi:hypothetical protein